METLIFNSQPDSHSVICRAVLCMSSSTENWPDSSSTKSEENSCRRSKSRLKCCRQKIRVFSKKRTSLGSVILAAENDQSPGRSSVARMTSDNSSDTGGCGGSGGRRERNPLRSDLVDALIRVILCFSFWFELEPTFSLGPCEGESQL